MSIQTITRVVLAVIATSLPINLLAQDAPAEPAETKRVQSSDFGELIKQLDADKFADRQAASQRLAEGGKASMPALTEAAQRDSREASTRAVEILKNHFQKGDDATKAAAKAALEKVAKGANQSAARRAEEVLNPKPEITEAPLRPGIIRINPAQIQIQVQNAGGGNVFRRANVKITNGVKEIDVDDNGKKVKIHDDPNNGIKVEVTQKNRDGQEETKKYEAKNAEELKKNHPEGHKIYEEYSRQQNGIQIRGLQLPGGIAPGALPGFLPQVPPDPPLPVLPNRILPQRIRPAPENNEQKERLEAAQARLDKATDLLKRLSQTNAPPDLVRQLGESIENAKKQLEEAKAKVNE